jgi:hypothetical protein
MNAIISNAIDKIGIATRRLLGDDMTKYYNWQHIQPTGTVKRAWEGVCKYLADIIDELQKESEE